MFAPYRMYRHTNNTDAIMEIVRAFYVSEKKLWKLKVRWWNVGSKHEPWPMGLEEKIGLSHDQVRGWVRTDLSWRPPEQQVRQLSFDNGTVTEIITGACRDPRKT